MFLILIYALKFKVINDARGTPSSDHHVYISCTYVYYKLVRSLHAYVADESRNFNPKLGCNKYLY